MVIHKNSNNTDMHQERWEPGVAVHYKFLHNLGNLVRPYHEIKKFKKG